MINAESMTQLKTLIRGFKAQGFKVLSNDGQRCRTGCYGRGADECNMMSTILLRPSGASKTN
ncbi:MAG: hypothetical protein V8S58_05645 [Lachnospiraceae bacterium]